MQEIHLTGERHLNKHNHCVSEIKYGWISFGWQGSVKLRSPECMYIKPYDYLISATGRPKEPYKETFRSRENIRYMKNIVTVIWYMSGEGGRTCSIM